ncbi:MAG: hypothetical protein ACOY0T_19060 [Myxococcota bacterium]
MTRLLCRAAFCLVLIGPAHAQTEAPPSLGEEPTRRELVLRIEGALDANSEATLRSVLEAELARLSVHATLLRSSQRLDVWIVTESNRPNVLVVAVLDVQSAQGWQLTVVDAARGRAIRRELHGGVATDAAAHEAVASVLASAAAALQEGLEVASRPIAEVVPASEPPSPPTASTPKSAPPATGAVRPTRQMFGEVGGGVASLAHDLSLAPHLRLALGLRVEPGFALRAQGLLSLPSRFTNQHGDFELDRRALGASFGFAQRLAPRVALEPAVGLSLELVRRRDSVPAGSATAAPDSSAWRLGPFAQLQLQMKLARWMALGLGGSLAYYPRSIRYLARTSGATPPVELTRLNSFSWGTEFAVIIQAGP